MDRRTFLGTAFAGPLAATVRAEDRVSRFLYVVCPGIRDYLEFGGAGILVFDIDDGHKFVKRIDTAASKAAKPRNIKGGGRQRRHEEVARHHARIAVLR